MWKLIWVLTVTDAVNDDQVTVELFTLQCSSFSQAITAAFLLRWQGFPTVGCETVASPCIVSHTAEKPRAMHEYTHTVQWHVSVAVSLLNQNL